MKFYKVNKDYMKYLNAKEPLVFMSEKSIGIIIRLDGFIYYVPVDSIDDSDKQENGSLKRNTPPIMRFYDQNSKPLCKCLFSNMIPVPYNEIEYINIEKLNSSHLLNNELDVLNQNEKRIITWANRIYKQKAKNYNIPYLKQTIDFKKAEKLALEYENQKYGKHINRFPDAKYFLTNPYETGDTHYYLMSKNHKIAKIVLNNETLVVKDIVEELEIDYAPLECFKDGKLKKEEMTSWFRGRGIPSWRDGLDDFLENIGIKNRDALLNKAFGLSLSDQYWMNPVDAQMSWDDINFFDHDFDSQDYIQSEFMHKVTNKDNMDFYTPNNTSDGMLKKAWVVEDGKRYLLKGSYKKYQFEPLNEVLASMICKVLELDYVPYAIDYISQTIVSKCECFVTKDTELISAYSIMKYHQIDYDLTAKELYKKYISILQEQGLKNVKEDLAKMFILDYLIVNTDRHAGNFGVIRNVETHKWMKIAPVYDSGLSMFSQDSMSEMDFNHPRGRFFVKESIDFDAILSIVLEDVQLEIDNDALRLVVGQWNELIDNYKYDIGLTEERKNRLVEGLSHRIECLLKNITSRI